MKLLMRRRPKANEPVAVSTASSFSPVHRVLHTIELLELILQEVSLKDLLRIQSTCKTIEAAIRFSPRFQRALYQRPQPEEDRGFWVLGDLRGLQIDLVRPESLDLYTAYTNVYAINPMLLQIVESKRMQLFPGSNTSMPVGLWWRLEFHIIFDDGGMCLLMTPGKEKAESLLKKLTKALLGPSVPGKDKWPKLATNASCRSMQLSKPPVHQVVVHTIACLELKRPRIMSLLRSEEYSRGRSFVVTNEQGITLDDVLEAAKREIGDRNEVIGSVQFLEGFVVTPEEKDLVEVQGGVRVPGMTWFFG